MSTITKERTITDLINEDNLLSKPICSENPNKKIFSNGDTSVSKAFSSYKLALKKIKEQEVSNNAKEKD